MVKQSGFNKRNMRDTVLYKRVIASLVLLLLIFGVGMLAACGTSEANTDNQGKKDITANNNSDKLYSFVIPQSLFFGKTGDALVEEISDSTATFLLKTGEEVPASQMISGAQLNEDGTVTMFFSEDQLKRYKSFLRDCASLYTYIDTYPESSIKSTKFPKDDLTEIIVYVDSKTYENTSTDGIFANGYTATNMGMYQVLNGVNPDDWSAHVMVRDYKTKKIITEDYYPNG